MRGVLPLLVLLVLALAACRALPPRSEPGIGTASPTGTPGEDVYTESREQMVRHQIEARGITDPRTLKAMRAVPRHRFVPSDLISRAYEDRPLPIGYGQTISQPYIVALMTEALRVEPGDRVLEIGTGSGYQAAVLAEIGCEVYTVEIIPQLAEQATRRLHELGYERVHVKQGDGYFGWPEHAPYDAIIVTAAPDHLPQPLIEQLAPGGRLVIPIGPQGSYQTLWLFEKGADGQLQATNLGPVLFVPLVREEP